MKRVGFILIVLFLGLVLYSQEQKQEITSVETPRFNPDKKLMYSESNTESPICCFIKNNITFPFNTLDYDIEGIVIVKFIIDANGNLDYPTVLHSIKPEIDNAVINNNCINSTTGMWDPGKINGQPVAMPHKVYVRFDIPYNDPHELVAREHLSKAMKLFAQSETISNEKKANRKLNKALDHLKVADRYQPEEVSIAYWKIRVYDKLGDTDKKAAELDDFFTLCIDESHEMPINMAGGE
ncbi:MAG: energy transducer TonB [Bacteroidales bacterium]|nr:energy transducer TonB [Bacteroidales bacterium]